MTARQSTGKGVLFSCIDYILTNQVGLPAVCVYDPCFRIPNTGEHGHRALRCHLNVDAYGQCMYKQRPARAIPIHKWPKWKADQVADLVEQSDTASRNEWERLRSAGAVPAMWVHWCHVAETFLIDRSGDAIESHERRMFSGRHAVRPPQRVFVGALAAKSDGAATKLCERRWSTLLGRLKELLFQLRYCSTGPGVAARRERRDLLWDKIRNSLMHSPFCYEPGLKGVASFKITSIPVAVGVISSAIEIVEQHLAIRQERDRRERRDAWRLRVNTEFRKRPGFLHKICNALTGLESKMRDGKPVSNQWCTHEKLFREAACCLKMGGAALPYVRWDRVLGAFMSYDGTLPARPPKWIDDRFDKFHSFCERAQRLPTDHGFKGSLVAAGPTSRTVYGAQCSAYHPLEFSGYLQSGRSVWHS
eukprot:gene9746-12304_t